MDPIKVFNYIKSKNINFFTGIPDSLLKELNNVILSESLDKEHIITANEGSAIALATGYHLATNKIPLVYLQNSGTGNIINPLMSLASDKVYSIPMLIIIGWRGEPGIKDEPQHISQGECMIELIKSLKINYDILPNNIEECKNVIDKLVHSIKIQSKPNILLVKKNAFSKCNLKPDINNNYTIYRKKAIECILKYYKNDIILSTTGKSSRELLETVKEMDLQEDNIFLNVGAMGHVSMISLGVAMNTNKRVICLDGDGSIIMHMGNLTNIGNSKCSNLIHIVLNNGMHESVGIQPTLGFDINIPNIAENCGYVYTIRIKTLDELNMILEDISSQKLNGPALIEVMITNKVNYTHELSRPKNTPLERKQTFMDFIQNSK